MPFELASSVSVRQMPKEHSRKRAQILQTYEEELRKGPKQRQMTKRKTARRTRSRRHATRSKLRFSKAGRVVIKLPGFPRAQHLSASALIRLLPVTKVRLAAKRLVGKPQKKSRKGHRKARTARKKRRSRRSTRR